MIQNKLIRFFFFGVLFLHLSVFSMDAPSLSDARPLDLASVPTCNHTGESGEGVTEDVQLRLFDENYDTDDEKDPVCPGRMLFDVATIEEAVQRGDLVELVAFLANDLDFRGVRRDSGRTLIHLAALYGQREVLFLLEMSGCDIHQLDNYGKSVLHYAAAGGHLSLLKELVNVYKLDIHCVAKDEWSLLHEAGKYNRIEVINWLVTTCGFPVGQITKGNYVNVLHIAATYGHQDLIERLLKRYRGRLNIHYTTLSGASVLQLAALHGHQRLIDWLVKTHGFDIRQRFRGGNLLHCAAINGHETLIEWLVREHGFDINEPVSGSARTALDIANGRRGNNYRFIQFLIRLGAHPGARSRQAPTRVLEQEVTRAVSELPNESGVSESTDSSSRRKRKRADKKVARRTVRQRVEPSPIVELSEETRSVTDQHPTLPVQDLPQIGLARGGNLEHEVVNFVNPQLVYQLPMQSVLPAVLPANALRHPVVQPTIPYQWLFTRSNGLNEDLRALMPTDSVVFLPTQHNELPQPINSSELVRSAFHVPRARGLRLTPATFSDTQRGEGSASGQAEEEPAEPEPVPMEPRDRFRAIYQSVRAAGRVLRQSDPLSSSLFRSA